jgi:hypothetical protein
MHPSQFRGHLERELAAAEADKQGWVEQFSEKDYEEVGWAGACCAGGGRDGAVCGMCVAWRCARWGGCWCSETIAETWGRRRPEVGDLEEPPLLSCSQ